MVHRVSNRTPFAPIAIAALFATFVGLGACHGGGIDEGGAPRLLITRAGQEISDGGVITYLDDSAPSSESLAVAVAVDLHNTGSAPLEIRSVTLTSDPPGALTLAMSPTPSASEPAVVPAPVGDSPSSVRVDILRAAVDGPPPTATLQIETNYTLALADTFQVSIEAVVGPPVLVIDPAVVTFGTVGQGGPAELPLTLLNTGGSELVIERVGLAGDDGFEVLAGELPIGVDAAAAQEGVTLAPPLTIAAGSAAVLPVSFIPGGPEAAAATLTLHTNDPQHADGRVVPLTANSQAPCITLDPDSLAFGAHLPGSPVSTTVHVTSCGGGPLLLDDIELVDDVAGAFELSGLDGLSFPLDVPPGESLTFQVTYTAMEVSPLDALGAPIRDTAQIRLGTDTWFGEIVLPLSGYGVDTICPTPVIVVQEGDEVLPQTVLHLFGNQSHGPAPISGWQWEVEQPVGSASPMLPSLSAPNPVFEANVAGTYVFTLRVTDETGVSCGPPATFSVLVTPEDGIHVELLWDTAGDLDQSDEGPEAGADLDLHFAHPFAAHADLDDDGLVDPWFDIPFDCFWFNTKPNWGVFAPAISDDAHLDRDDTDGAGPENVNLEQPEDGLTYRVGVHYWNDHGFGPSDATVRIYIHKQLVFEVVLEDMVVGDLWDAATIAWPSGEVSLVVTDDGAFDVTPNIVMADFMGN